MLANRDPRADLGQTVPRVVYESDVVPDRFLKWYAPIVLSVTVALLFLLPALAVAFAGGRADT